MIRRIMLKMDYKRHIQSTFKRLESQWVGKDFDRFVLRHGSPYKQFNLNNGDILYTSFKCALGGSTTR
jgi:hypothetical protein